MKRLHAFALIAVALAFGAFTGAAVAGGNGNGNGGSAPGNSANAPGQQTQEGQPAQPATQQPAPAQSAPATSSHGVNATSVGMKPGPTTKKDVHTTVGASPDVSKRYGNGKTAAQIAKGRGAPANTDIYGPGNSQPHKVCGKNGHYVDVHA